MSILVLFLKHICPAISNRLVEKIVTDVCNYNEKVEITIKLACLTENLPVLLENTNNSTVDFILVCCAFSGWSQGCCVALDRGAKRFLLAMEEAIKNKKPNIISLLAEKHKNDELFLPIIYFDKPDYFTLVNKFVEYEPKKTIATACCYGRLKMLKFLMNKHPEQLKDAFVTSCKSGQLECVKLLESLGKVNISDGAIYAAVGNNLHVLEHLNKTGKVNWYTTFYMAFHFKNVKLAKIILKKRKLNVNDILKMAVKNSNIKLARFAIKNNATNLFRLFHKKNFIEMFFNK